MLDVTQSDKTTLSPATEVQSAALAVKDLIQRIRKASRSKLSEIRHYVLDTNVLLHDPMALFQFEEHTLYLPLVVLEELDRHKKGLSDLARNARQVTRTLDALLQKGSLVEGFDLSGYPGSLASGRLFIVQAQTAIPGLESGQADNQILSVARELTQGGLKVALVSNDINLRVKALANEIVAQGYRSDRVLSDEDVLPSGILRINGEYWSHNQKGIEEPFWNEKDQQFAQVNDSLPLNTFVIETTGRDKERTWRVVVSESSGSTLRSVRNASGSGRILTARNTEQSLALELLRDAELDLVSLLGVAGTGKTLLALAAGIEQVRSGVYKEILITRATIPMGEEIGFLPGTEQEKMSAWLGGTLKDAYSALKLEESDPVREKIEIASMSFMRGRSFHDKFIIIDEAQNLTVPQIKALLTRSANGSKVVLTGNLGQIDTPYLDQGNSGLTWAVTKTCDWPHSGHLILPRGVRSRLATYIEECTN